MPSPHCTPTPTATEVAVIETEPDGGVLSAVHTGKRKGTSNKTMMTAMVRGVYRKVIEYSPQTCPPLQATARPAGGEKQLWFSARIFARGTLPWRQLSALDFCKREKRASREVACG